MALFDLQTVAFLVLENAMKIAELHALKSDPFHQEAIDVSISRTASSFPLFL